MLRHCRGPQRQRLMNKFTENDYEKVDRLLELHFKYLTKVELIDKEVENMEKVMKFSFGFNLDVNAAINYNLIFLIRLIDISNIIYK